jgi:hypothetical protein
MIQISSSGTYSGTKSWLDRLLNADFYGVLDKYGRLGVDALSANTPQESGLTAASWGYTVTTDGETYAIEWYNDNTINGTPLALMLQYGHGTGTGGYVEGIDYINPSLIPVFDSILADLIKEIA